MLLKKKVNCSKMNSYKFKRGGAQSPPFSGALWQMTEFAPVITLIGAGGKTTTLQTLTKEIHALGHQVIATTTTKVYPMPFLSLWRGTENPPPQDIETPCFWYTEPDLEKRKWIGPSKEVVDQAIREAKHRSGQGESNQGRLRDPIWIIEGDGAREKKLKCWASHEPQIPTETQCGILILDGGLWGKVLTDEAIHRAEECPGLVGQSWTVEKGVNYLLRSPVFDPRYKNIFWIVLFNEFEAFTQNPTNQMYNKRYLAELVAKLRETFQGQSRSKDLNLRPSHLRIASGNAKEGRVRWCDLW